MAAGAIASGRPLPKLPVQPVVAAARPDATERSELTSMAARLSHVEKLNQQQAAKLTKQAQEIQALRSEVSMLQRFADAVTEDTMGEVDGEHGTSSSRRSSKHTEKEFEVLRAERDHFERQVEEMTKFLEDYGLTWVGDGCSDKTDGEDADASGEATTASDLGTEILAKPSGSEGHSPSHSPARSSSVKVCSPQHVMERIHIDIPTLTARVKALNDMVESKGARVVSSLVGGAVHARLVADDTLPLPISFFRDGVKLADLPFHVYSSRDAQTIIRDIMDGYFPYALKDAYPDGVAMRVIDRMMQDFERWLREHAAIDPDLTDRGDRLLPAGGRIIRSCSSRAGIAIGGRAVDGGRSGAAGSSEVQAMGSEQPAATRPRSGNAAHHRGASAPAAPVVRTPPDEISLLDADRDSSAPLARIQVKLEGGERIILCMEPEQTIGSLEDALSHWRDGRGLGSKVGGRGSSIGGAKRLALRSAFPPRTYDERTATLREAGLTPNATLFVSSEPLCDGCGSSGPSLREEVGS